MADFDFFAEVEQPDSPTASDYGKAAYSGLGQLSSSVQSGLAYAADKLGEKEAEQKIRKRGAAVRAETEATIESMSPVARERLQSSVLTKEFWDHPLSAGALKMTQMAPSTVAAGAAGAAGGVAGLGVIGETALAAGVNSALVGGEYMDEVRSRVSTLDDAALKAANPYYAGLRTLMPEDEARAQLETKLIEGGGRLPINLLIGALGGATGLPGMIARGGKGAISGGLRRRVALGAAEGSVPEAVEEGVGDITGQQAANEGGMQQGYKLDQTLAAALEGALLGGVPGAGLGALHKATPPAAAANAGVAPGAGGSMAGLFTQKQAVNVPPVANGQAPTGAASTGATPKTTRATTQPPPNVSAQAGEIGNTVNPPTRDQEPGTAKEAAAGAKGKAATQTSKKRSRVKPGIDAEAPVVTVAPDVQEALAQSTPGDPTQVILAEPPKPAPDASVLASADQTVTPPVEPSAQVFASAPEAPLAEAPAPMTPAPMTPAPVDMAPEAPAPMAPPPVEQPGAVTVGDEPGTGMTDPAVFDEALARKEAEEQLRAKSPGLVTEDNIRAGVETRRKEWEIEQEKERADARRAKRDLEEIVAEEKENAPPAPPQDFKSKKNPGRDAKRADNRAKSDELFAAHSEGMSTTGRGAILERAKKILTEAKERGVSIANKLDYTKHSAGQAFLKEAQILVSRARSSKTKLPSAEDIHRFSQAEFDLRQGLEGYDRYKKNAQAEGDARHGAKFNEKFQKDAKAKSDERSEVSGDLEMRGEGDEFSEDDKGGEAQPRTLADVAIDREDERFEVGADGEVRQKPIQPEAKPKVELKGDEVNAVESKAGTFKTQTRPKFDAGRPKVEGKISLTRPGKPKSEAPRPMAAELSLEEFERATATEPRKTAEEGYVYASHTDNTPIKIQRTDTVENLLRRVPLPNTLLAGALFPVVRARLIHTVGHVKVHFVDHADVASAVGSEKGQGYYLPNWRGDGDYIVLSKDIPAERLAHILTHEALHAATSDALREDPRVRGHIQAIYDEVLAANPEHAKRYGFTNLDEFVAEAFSSPEFQAVLATTQVSRGLAQKLGLEKPSLWSALIETIRRVVGAPKGSYTALEAMVRPVNEAIRDRAFWQQFDTMGEASPFIDRDAVTREVTGQATNIGSHLRTVKRTFASNTMLARMAESLGHNFGELARKANELHERMAVRVDSILRKAGGVHELTIEGDKLRRAHPADMDEAFALGHEFSEHDLDGSAGAANAHVFGRGATSDILNAAQAKVAYRSLKARLDALRARNPAVADWLEKTAKYYREDDNARRLAVIRSVLDSSGIGDKANPGLAERIFDNQLRPSDVPLFQSLPILQHLNEIVSLKRMKGWYFPFMREGDNVVTARKDIPTSAAHHLVRQMDAAGNYTNEVLVLDPSGKDRFAPTRRAARAYMEQLQTRHKLHAKAEQVYVLKSDRSTIVPRAEAEAIGAPETFKAYKVVINDAYTSFHKTPAERDRIAGALEAQGYNNVQRGKRQDNPNARFGGLVPSQVETLINSLQRGDKFGRMPPAEQNALIHTLRETAIKLLPGTRIQHHNLQRKNVEGYQQDMIHSLARYGQQSAAFQARTEFQPEIDKAISEMREDINKDSGKNTEKKDEIVRDLETRLSIGADIKPPGLIDKTVNFVNKLSMLDKLVGPSFHIINAQEPWTTAAPVIGGRHGFGSAIGALKGAYNMIGARGALAAGFRDTRKAFSQDEGFTDYRSDFKRQIAAGISGDRGRRINEMLDHLHDLNLFGHEAGMEVHRLAQPADTAVGRVVDRIDLMSRQVGQAIEAINRAATGIAAYELEFRKNGGNHEAAMRYAHDIVHDTMGNYSASNSAPVFNTTLGKSALQFKKFAVRTYYLLGSTLGRARSGDREAQRAFAGVMFTHAVVAGALGLPLEPIKVALMASGALGGYSWDDFENLVRDTAARALGKTGGEAVTRGIPRAFLGYDAAGRQGLDSLLTFGKPLSGKPNDIKSYLFDTIAGAPAGMPVKGYTGIKAIADGDVEKAIDNLIPVKAIRDIARAGFGVAGGKKDRTGRQQLSPYSPYEATVQALGFTPSRKAESYEESRRVNDASFERKADRSGLINDWVNAGASDKRAAWRAVQEFNRTVPRDAQITMSQLRSQTKSRRDEKLHGKYDRGMRIGKQNRDIYDRAQRTYSGG